MTKAKIRPASLATGAITLLPGGNDLLLRRTQGKQGGTFSARYCYAVWLRHLVRVWELGLLGEGRRGPGAPAVVAELGPGNSVGAGLAALLSGAEQYWAFDLVRHSDSARNMAVFDELVALFEQRAAIPGPDEFPEIKTPLASWAFPSAILPDELLAETLAPQRVAAVRAALLSLDQGNGRSPFISYVVPWNDPAVVAPDSVDMIFSMSVLEHIDDLAYTYAAAYRWLRPGAWMSHEIDFRSHRHAAPWNGHWAISQPVWRVMRGRRPYFINRQPRAAHIDLLRGNGFELICDAPQVDHSGIERSQLAAEFRAISDEDLTTYNVFVVARKPAIPSLEP